MWTDETIDADNQYDYADLARFEADLDEAHRVIEEMTQERDSARASCARAREERNNANDAVLDAKSDARADLARFEADLDEAHRVIEETTQERDSARAQLRELAGEILATAREWDGIASSAARFNHCLRLAERARRRVEAGGAGEGEGC